MESLGAAILKFSIAHADHYSRHSSEPASLCLDTGTSLSLVAGQIFSKYFPEVDIKALEESALRVSVARSDSPVTTEGYALLELRLRSLTGTPEFVTGQSHTVASLDCNILLGNDIILYPCFDSIHIGRQLSTWNVEEVPVPVRVIHGVRQQLQDLAKAADTATRNGEQGTVVANDKSSS